MNLVDKEQRGCPRIAPGPHEHGTYPLFLESPSSSQLEAVERLASLPAPDGATRPWKSRTTQQIQLFHAATFEYTFTSFCLSLTAFRRLQGSWLTCSLLFVWPLAAQALDKHVMTILRRASRGYHAKHFIGEKVKVDVFSLPSLCVVSMNTTSMSKKPSWLRLWLTKLFGVSIGKRVPGLLCRWRYRGCQTAFLRSISFR